MKVVTVGCVTTGKKRLDFDADQRHDPDTRIFDGIVTGILPGSAALAEVCGLRVASGVDCDFAVTRQSEALWKCLLSYV